MRGVSVGRSLGTRTWGVGTRELTNVLISFLVSFPHFSIYYIRHTRLNFSQFFIEKNDAALHSSASHASHTAAIQNHLFHFL
jgi:hypothetical protein